MPSLQEKNKQGDKGGQKQKAKGSPDKKSGGGFFNFRIPRATEGVVARRAALVLLCVLWFVGGYQLYNFLESYEFWSEAWGGVNVPLLQIPVNLALVTAVGVFVVGGVVSFGLLNRGDAADFLIETETEMKKVTWPTKEDSMNATLVVITTVIVLGLLLALFDFLLRGLFSVIY